MSSDAGLSIETQALTKLYPIPRTKQKRTAVSDLTIQVAGGEVFGFLGPNGAGKTTTIKMLLGFIRPSNGRGFIFGTSIEDDSARNHVGFVPEQPYFPKFLSAIETVRMHALLSGVPMHLSSARADTCLKEVGMFENRYSQLAKLSKGMTQRVGVACALVGSPRVLILDEPSSGLDPAGRKELRELLSRLKTDGVTVFLSSHLLSEMESVCDRVGILDHGKLVACGKPSDIVQVKDSVEIELLADASATDSAKLEGAILTEGAQMHRVPGEHIAHVIAPNEHVYSIVEVLRRHQAKLLSILPVRESLEDAFLRLVS